MRKRVVYEGFEEPEVLVKRARTLVKQFKDPQDVAPFSKLSYDESFVISKYYLIHELIKLGEYARGAVLDCVKDKNHLVRELALKTLGEIGDNECVPTIVECLDDGKRRVRAAALSSLKKITSLSFGSYAKRNKNQKSEDEIIKRWQIWWKENEETFMEETSESLVETA